MTRWGRIGAEQDHAVPNVLLPGGGLVIVPEQLHLGRLLDVVPDVLRLAQDLSHHRTAEVVGVLGGHREDAAVTGRA
jgi:hypothetical protein